MVENVPWRWELCEESDLRTFNSTMGMEGLSFCREIWLSCSCSCSCSLTFFTLGYTAKVQNNYYPHWKTTNFKENLRKRRTFESNKQHHLRIKHQWNLYVKVENQPTSLSLSLLLHQNPKPAKTQMPDSKIWKTHLKNLLLFVA